MSSKWLVEFHSRSFSIDVFIIAQHSIPATSDGVEFHAVLVVLTPFLFQLERIDQSLDVDRRAQRWAGGFHGDRTATSAHSRAGQLDLATDGEFRRGVFRSDAPAVSRRCARHRRVLRELPSGRESQSAPRSTSSEKYHLPCLYSLDATIQHESTDEDQTNENDPPASLVANESKTTLFIPVRMALRHIDVVGDLHHSDPRFAFSHHPLVFSGLHVR